VVGLARIGTGGLMHATDRSSIARAESDNFRRRVAINGIATGLMVLCALIVLVPLFIVAGYVLQQGWSSLIGHFPSVFTTDSGQNQLLDGLKGTALLVAFASAIGLPIGILSGIYLAEFGRNRFGDTVRFVTDVIAGLPSIVAGIVANTVLVATTHTYSVFAGALALGLLMFPTVTRTTEGVIRLVPDNLREGGLALGVTRWRTIVSIIVPSALGGIITGVILGIARVAGETAPLIFTVFGNTYGYQGLNQPLAALPLQIYTFIFSPPDDPATDYQYAFAGVMLLFLFVVTLNLLARFFAARQSIGRR